MHNQKIQQQIDQTFDQHKYQKFTGSIGTIMTYDKYSNMATVLVSKTETDEAGDILKNVPCPSTLGVQTVAPTPGLMCYVVFRNGNLTQPLITHYYNHRYSTYDYNKQSPSINNLPSYILG